MHLHQSSSAFKAVFGLAVYALAILYAASRFSAVTISLLDRDSPASVPLRG